MPQSERLFSPQLEESPPVASLLGAAGLTAVDLQLFKTLRERNFSIFVHGSIMENRFKDSSDIDFVVIGDLEDIPTDIKDTLMPRLLSATALKKISYTSTSNISQNGRKMSLHISEPGFRSTYGTAGHTIASEYRPSKHAKVGARNYLLSGMSSQNDTYLINFTCNSDSVEGGQGTITDTPQTGEFTLDGTSVYTENNHNEPVMAASDIIRIAANGDVSEGPFEKPVDVMILGLEFDKMQSDTPLYHDSLNNGEYEEFVINPIRRSMRALGDYTGIDSNVVTKKLFGELAKYWPKIKPTKTRKK